MLPEIGAPVKAQQHPLDDREHIGVVGVRAQKAERFMQPHHLAGGAQADPFEAAQQRELGRGGFPAVVCPLPARAR